MSITRRVLFLNNLRRWDNISKKIKKKGYGIDNLLDGRTILI